LIIILSIVVSVVLIAVIIDYRLVYPYHLIFSSNIDYPKMHVYARCVDQYANAAVIEPKHNMVLIITLQDYREVLPEEEISFGRLLWYSNPRTWNYAEFFSHVNDLNLKIGVCLHKNSLVIIDGMTNETLLVHEITDEQMEQWDKDFRKRCYTPDFNVIDDVFKMFFVPEEKTRWYTLPEDLNDDTTVESNPESGRL